MRKTAYEVRISDWSSDVCSSDLPLPAAFFDANGADGNIERGVARRIDPAHGAGIDAAREGFDRIDDLHRPNLGRAGDRPARSEEHTSELQSLMRTSYAVFCLKKKNIGGFFMVRSYYTSECHDEYLDFERLGDVKIS